VHDGIDAVMKLVDAVKSFDDLPQVSQIDARKGRQPCLGWNKVEPVHGPARVDQVCYYGLAEFAAASRYGDDFHSISHAGSPFLKLPPDDASNCSTPG
jgi:hypothetical protein